MGKLPTAKTKPSTDLGRYPVLIYGYPKVGKSTFASKFPDAVFFATEPGYEALSVYAMNITSWEDFCNACGALVTEEHKFKTVIVDTIGNLWEMCRHYVRREHNFMYESDLDWGKGWNLVKEEFARALVKLSLLNIGLVIISHADEKDIKTSRGTSTLLAPSLQKGARDVILPLVSFILYFEVLHTEDGDQYVIRTRATDRFIGGMRTPEGRELPDPLPMDFDIFQAAFKRALVADESSAKPKTKKE